MTRAETREKYEAARRLLSKAKRILVSGHRSPDGDSLGSTLALVHMLRAAGWDAWGTANPDALGKPGFLEGANDLIPPKRLKNKRFDLFFCVDCATVDRLPPEAIPFAERLPTVIIDHHATNRTSGPAAIIDPDAAATGELVWSFAKWMEWPITQPVADALWTALITDTGRFSYDSVRPNTLRAARDLLVRGARTSLINDILFCSFTPKALELKRRAWRALHVWKDRRVAETSLSRADFREVRGTKADAEDVVDIPRNAERNEIALFFYELPERAREVKISIRTREPWNAMEIAARFGGGGHLHAAGCTIKASMGVAKRQMRAAIREMLKNGPGRRNG